MFIVKVNGKEHLWNNKVEDDFIQFLPEYFGVSMNEIEIKNIPNGHLELKKASLQLTDEEIAAKTKIEMVIENGSAKLIKITPPKVQPSQQDPNDIIAAQIVELKADEKFSKLSWEEYKDTDFYKKQVTDEIDVLVEERRAGRTFPIIITLADEKIAPSIEVIKELEVVDGVAANQAAISARKMAEAQLTL